MVQGNKKIVSSIQSAAARGVPHLPPRVTRVRKLSMSRHHSFKNNKRPTKSKSDNIIHVKIRPSTINVPGIITENLLSV
jgi:hypothetical protein